MKSSFVFIVAVSSLWARGPQRQQAYLVADLDTGKILKKKNIHTLCYPASLTKMMTAYLLFEDLFAGRITLKTTFAVSYLAQQQIKSHLGLKRNDKITVKILLEALIIKSANDAAVVIAEGLAGSVTAFVNRMNAKAKTLHMSATHFRNPSGIPDARQTSSARDLAVLVRALWRDFPQYMHWFQQRSFTFRQKTYWTHNYLLNTLPGTNGMKTGYIDASGYNLALTVERYDMNRRRRRFLCIYLGGTSGFARDQAVISLLEPLFLEENAVYYDLQTPSSQKKSVSSTTPKPRLIRAMICSPRVLSRLLLQYEIHQKKLQEQTLLAADISSLLAQKCLPMGEAPKKDCSPPLVMRGHTERPRIANRSLKKY